MPSRPKKKTEGEEGGEGGGGGGGGEEAPPPANTTPVKKSLSAKLKVGLVGGWVGGKGEEEEDLPIYYLPLLHPPTLLSPPPLNRP